MEGKGCPPHAEDVDEGVLRSLLRKNVRQSQRQGKCCCHFLLYSPVRELNRSMEDLNRRT